MNYSTCILLLLTLHVLTFAQQKVDNSKPSNIRIIESDNNKFFVDSADIIEQWGIKWFFNKKYPVGRFANGDYWVVGNPVIIEKITPAFDGKKNGWQVNPSYSDDKDPIHTQGFDIDAFNVNNFDTNLVPNLPFQAYPGMSIVKAISSGKIKRGCLSTVAVLTVLDSIPINRGLCFLRPPFIEGAKPLININHIDYSQLPALNSVSSMPTLDWIEKRYERVQFELKGGPLGRYLHPVENMPDYGGDIGVDNGDAIIRLMFNDDIQKKKKSIIYLLQYANDLYHAILNGHTFPDGGGHRPGQKIILCFAATLLGHTGMEQILKNNTSIFQENTYIYTNSLNEVLFGINEYSDKNALEEFYWKLLFYGSGNKTMCDPYNYIDGGRGPGLTYQSILSKTFVPSALALILMPELKLNWDNHEQLIKYSERWMSKNDYNGNFIYQPDICAPVDSTWDNYGITFGPDGKGDCIKDFDTSDGLGRFPKFHGTYDTVHVPSIFIKNVWRKYVNTY